MRTTYDILNCGPRSRFVIRTDEGPMIVHNCGYRLGGGEEHGEGPERVLTGLWGYAENMGVKMTREEAHHAVRVFREAFPEVVQLWYDLENAAKKTVTTNRPTEVGVLRFDMQAPFLRMRLPSGRYLYYLRPAIKPVQTPWGEVRDTLTYEGFDQKKNKWVRMATHGGRICENADQAISRDILCHGMMKAHRRDFFVIGHVHDEVITEMPIDTKLTISDLEECLAEVPPWADGLVLGAAGFETTYYKKDG